MKDYYYILGVKENATKNEIRIAYRKLSKKFHPDVNDGDKFFESRFKEINEAYEILSNETQRSIYDLSRNKESNKKSTNDPPKPSIKEFSLTKYRVHIGEEIELKWHVDNCESVTINLFGKVSLSGNKKLIFKESKNNLKIKLQGYNVHYGMITKELELDIIENKPSYKQDDTINHKDYLKKYYKYVILIISLLILGYLTFRLNPGNEIKPINPLSSNQKDTLDTTKFVLNGVNPYLDIMISEDMIYLDSSFYINKKVPLWNYLDKLIQSVPYSKPITRLIKTENQKEYLFILTYTGGAHCCFEYRAFKYDAYNTAYKNIGAVSFDASECGEPEDIVYPVLVNTRINYFHSSYASSLNDECSENNYREELVIKNDTLMIINTGDAYKLEQCIISYVSNHQIPELQDNDDSGERELILNMLNNLYNLTKNLDKIFFIYNTYMPNIQDRTSFWFEILETIIPANKIKETEITEKIIEYKYCMDIRMSLFNANKIHNNTPRHDDLIYYIFEKYNKENLYSERINIIKKYENKWDKFISDHNIMYNGKLNKLELLVDKIIFDVPLSKEENNYIKQKFTLPTNLNLPNDYVLPSICDINPGSGWEYVKFKNGIHEPYHISGDFNGDNLIDHAYLLYSQDIFNYNLFCFLKSPDSYILYKLPYPNNDTHPVTDYCLYEAKKNELVCLYDENGQSITEKVKLKNSGIVVSGFEFGEPIIYVYNNVSMVFENYWSCIDE